MKTGQNYHKMKKCKIIIYVYACLLLVSSGQAQQNLQGLIRAEKQFAAFTSAHTVKEGFLKYMDSMGLVFRQGMPVNARETYRQQNAGPAILSWYPDFALISASGDLGVTTGPYERRLKNLSDTPSGRGSFSSVWRYRQNGGWTNIVDIGTAYASPNPFDTTVMGWVLKNSKKDTGSFSSVIRLDEQLNKAIFEKNKTVWLQYVLPEARLNVEGRIPYRGADAIQHALQDFPQGLVLQYIGGNISASKDLVYVYGSSVNGAKKENYLRIWVRRNRVWRVILQTIQC